MKKLFLLMVMLFIGMGGRVLGMVAARTTLGIAPGTVLTPDVVNKAYRKLSAKWHPDRFENSTDAEKINAQAKFQEVINAKDALIEHLTTGPTVTTVFDLDDALRQVVIDITTNNLETLDKKLYLTTEDWKDIICKALDQSTNELLYLKQSLKDCINNLLEKYAHQEVMLGLEDYDSYLNHFLTDQQWTTLDDIYNATITFLKNGYPALRKKEISAQRVAAIRDLVQAIRQFEKGDFLKNKIYKNDPSLKKMDQPYKDILGNLFIIIDFVREEKADEDRFNLVQAIAEAKFEINCKNQKVQLSIKNNIEHAFTNWSFVEDQPSQEFLKRLEEKKNELIEAVDYNITGNKLKTELNNIAIDIQNNAQTGKHYIAAFTWIPVIVRALKKQNLKPFEENLQKCIKALLENYSDQEIFLKPDDYMTYFNAGLAKSENLKVLSPQQVQTLPLDIKNLDENYKTTINLIKSNASSPRKKEISIRELITEIEKSQELLKRIFPHYPNRNKMTPDYKKIPQNLFAVKKFFDDALSDDKRFELVKKLTDEKVKINKELKKLRTLVLEKTTTKSVDEINAFLLKQELDEITNAYTGWNPEVSVDFVKKLTEEKEKQEVTINPLGPIQKALQKIALDIKNKPQQMNPTYLEALDWKAVIAKGLDSPDLESLKQGLQDCIKALLGNYFDKEIQPLAKYYGTSFTSNLEPLTKANFATLNAADTLNLIKKIDENYKTAIQLIKNDDSLLRPKEPLIQALVKMLTEDEPLKNKIYESFPNKMRDNYKPILGNLFKFSLVYFKNIPMRTEKDKSRVKLIKEITDAKMDVNSKIKALRKAMLKETTHKTDTEIETDLCKQELEEIENAYTGWAEVSNEILAEELFKKETKDYYGTPIVEKDIDFIESLSKIQNLPKAIADELAKYIKPKEDPLTQKTKKLTDALTVLKTKLIKLASEMSAVKKKVGTRPN